VRTIPKILILFASYGDGHVQVTNALQHYFQQNKLANVIAVDLFAESHPYMNAVTRYLFIKSSIYSPQLYGWGYHYSQRIQYGQQMTNWVNSLCNRKLTQIIEREKPDAVIHTFPMLTMMELRKKNGWSIPSVTVLTDFVLHPRWLHPETDKYFVATEDLRKKLISEGIERDRVIVSGIPIRQSFLNTFQKSDLLQRYNLDPVKKTILLMAGAYGVLSDVNKMVRSLLARDDIQILIVCGKNQDLRQKLQIDFDGVREVHVFGFVEFIEELMEISICMITKAGGVTLSEATAMQLPFIIYRPLPGQEEGNAHYFAQQGTGRVANNMDEMQQMVNQLLDGQTSGDVDPIRLKNARTMMNASKTIVTEVMQLIDINHETNIEINNAMSTNFQSINEPILKKRYN
jgi:processive 1,2-diacylglycerol beta-glucosyltransferase